jgi:DNA-binding NarL/FixJ family response regulator
VYKDIVEYTDIQLDIEQYSFENSSILICDMQRVLDSLNNLDREIFRLVSCGLTHKEIAKALNRSRQYVSKRVCLTRKKYSILGY